MLHSFVALIQGLLIFVGISSASIVPNSGASILEHPHGDVRTVIHDQSSHPAPIERTRADTSGVPSPFGTQTSVLPEGTTTKTQAEVQYAPVQRAPKPTVEPTPTVDNPIIEVLSPQTGEVWDTGTSHKIRWNIRGVSDPAAYAYTVGLGERQIIFGSLADDPGFIDWTVPRYFIPGDYRVNVELNNKWTSKNVFGGTFKIEASSSTPRVTLISPVGGEKWKIGSTHTVQWESFGLPENIAVDICLGTFGPTNTSTSICVPTTNTGEFSFTVPDNFDPATNYSLGIEARDASNAFQGGATHPTIEIYQ